MDITMTTYALETKSVVKTYPSDTGTIQAVDDVSLQVAAGEFVALVGPSGSGKTTMLSMLAALLQPSSGQILLDGDDLAGMGEKDRVAMRREKIGFTFQANNLIPFLTVRENVELMLRLNDHYDGDSRERTQQLIARLGLGDQADRLPNQLSGGQRQRAAIARSMIHDPSVILADEPTANLDTERAYQVTKLYAELIHENQKAGIMVTHDLRMCKYVDKIIQIEDGRIVSVLETTQEIQDLIACP